MNPSPHPFELLFGALVEPHFHAIREALGDHPSRDAFVLAAPAVELLQEVRPEEGLADASTDLVALVYSAWRWWVSGSVTRRLDLVATEHLCREVSQSPQPSEVAPCYIQLAPRRIWSDLEGEGQFEPLDGFFLVEEPDQLLIVALYGVHIERPGVSLAVVGGPRPAGVPDRPDGSPAFSPTMQGGDLAGLHAITTAGELLLLGWRAHDRHYKVA